MMIAKYFFLLISILSPQAMAGDEKTLHVRLLLSDNYDGIFIQSMYEARTDVVRWDVCGDKKDGNRSKTGLCRPIFPKDLKHADFLKYEEPLIVRLTELREREVKLSGEKDTNVRALDQIIASLKKEGLDEFLVDKPRGSTPDMSRGMFDMNSNTLFQKVVKEMKAVFEEPPPAVKTKPSPGPDEQGSQGHS